MVDANRTICRFAARAIWPLLLLPLILVGCASGPPTEYANVPGGAVAYPGKSYFFGPFTFHRLYSILPGSISLHCPEKFAIATGISPKVTLTSCYPGSEPEMKAIAEVLVRSFSFLDLASAGKIRFCEVAIALVDNQVGIYAVDTQSLHRPCARLKLVARWSPGFDSDSKGIAMRSIVRNTAHEAYHIALRREGLRERLRLTEETEANIVEFCAARVTSDKTEFWSMIEEVSLPEESDVGRHYADSLAGDRAAAEAIRDGTLLQIAEAAPSGAARNVLAKCSEVLKF